jgi:O-antigen/teichoic acid export membrane protein
VTEPAVTEPALTEPAGTVPATAPSPSRGLGAVAARGAAVTVTGQITRIVVQVCSLAVLSRLLDPGDYGLVALVLAVVAAGEVFRDFGLSAAAVQAKSLTSHQRDGLFWVNAGLGGALTVVTVLAAPLVALAVGPPDLGPITRVLALTFLINGCSAQYRAHLQRNLRFSSLAGADVAAQVAAVGLGIGLAVAGAGYWALVAQQLGQVGAGLLLLVVISRWLPGRPRRGVGLRPLVRFGWQYVAGQFVAYIGKNVDSLVVGARFGPVPLGFYNRGYSALMGPLGQLRAPTTTVALPVLSRVQDDEARFGAYVQQGQMALGYTFLPAIALAAGAAEPLVRILLGDKWLAVVPIFSALALAAVFDTLPYVGFWVYLSRGLTAQLLRFTMAVTALRVTCIVVGSWWGPAGVAVGIAVATGLAWPLSLWRLSRLTPLPLGGLVRGGLRILAMVALAALAAWAASRALSNWQPLVQLAAAFMASAAVYLAAGLLVPAVRRDEAVVAHMVRLTLAR